MAEPTDKDTRGPVNLRIKFRSESLQQFIERYGVDVSRGGIFIRTREPLPVGTRLKLDFQLVDTAPLFQGDGTVVWIREHDPARAGVTPGMGVRFDRLTPESQTTLDTILEEKIRLQQSGVAPGSIAKAGAGIAVRRPSGAFATLDAQAPRAGAAAPPPLPFEVKPAAPPPTPGAPVGAAPVAAMPATQSRSGQVSGAGSSSIFTRPRTTSGGLRTVPVPSALFEPPTAADIDKALSALEEKGGPPPALPIVPTVINRSESRPSTDDDPTKVFDAGAAQEFSDHDAVTGPAQVVPEAGVPEATGESGEGDMTERRAVDPASGDVVTDAQLDTTAEFGKKIEKPARKPPLPTAPTGAAGADAKPPVPLDAPLESLVDSGSAPAVSMPAAARATSASVAIPKKITTDRPQATESGRFRSDTRYKRQRGKGIYWAIGVLVVGAGVGVGGIYMKRERARQAAEQAAAAAAASPPLAAGQQGPGPAPTAPGAAGPVGETAVPPSGAALGEPAPSPTEAAGAAGKAAPQLEETVAKAEVKPDKAAKAEKQDTGRSAEKAEKTSDRPERSSRRRDRTASVTAETPGATAPKPEAAAEKKDEPKPAAETAKAEAPKPAEAAKPAEDDKPAEKPAAEKPAEAPKPAEAAPAAPPTLKITSTPPGAEVVIDGVPVGTTPFSSKDVTPDGTHAISLKKDGYETHERMISGSDWSRGKGGAQSLKFSVKLKRTGGDPGKPAAPAADKKDEVEILTPSEP
jgi:uncharacterized protein (TIGR02266 family)